MAKWTYPDGSHDPLNDCELCGLLFAWSSKACQLCTPCRTRYNKWQRYADKFMYAARTGKRGGNFPFLRGETLCVDCGIKPATVYEHRDYSDPLNVEKVCVSCNVKRGRGNSPNYDPPIFSMRGHMDLHALIESHKRIARTET